MKSDLTSNEGKYCSKWKTGYQEEYLGSGLPVFSIKLQSKPKEDRTVYLNLNGNLFVDKVRSLNIYELDKLHEVVKYIRKNSKYNVEIAEVISSLERHYFSK